MRTNAITRDVVKLLTGRVLNMPKFDCGKNLCVVTCRDFDNYCEVRDFLKTRTEFVVTCDAAVFALYVERGCTKELPSAIEDVVSELTNQFDNGVKDFPYAQKLMRHYFSMLGVDTVHYTRGSYVYHEAVEKVTEIGWGFWREILVKMKTNPCEIADRVLYYNK